jgi:hypothetical protein
MRRKARTCMRLLDLKALIGPYINAAFGSEFAFSHGSFGLPTMTCFIPGLPPGTPFNISLHSWNVPTLSSYTQTYSSHPEHAEIEARVFIDGRQVA